jgi:hypothetical protein
MNKAPAIRPRKVYKLGMYGRAGSGKTCILAALAMARITHPEQLSCTWIPEPAGLPRPAGDPENWDSHDPATAFHRGKEWLEAAIAYLARRDVPPPNPANLAEPLRFSFQFATPEPRLFPVELIDYSGELIDPSITNDALAQRLREHMAAMDGLLVLAEAPDPGRDTGPLSYELWRLAQAFALLGEEAQHGPALDVPVALLINKWDRRGALDFDNPDHENTRLQQFLESTPEPPHRALVQMLSNSVTEDNFAVFPVSAFGEHETLADGREIPKQVHPLKSFGLEDGFIHVARQRDAIDMARYEADVRRLSPWRFWQSVTHTSPWRLLRAGYALAARFPGKSISHQQVRFHAARAASIAATHVLCTIASVLFLLVASETFYDGFRTRSVLATLRSPQANEDQLRTEEQWLRAFTIAPVFRHTGSRLFVLSRAHANATLDGFWTQRDELAWQNVAQTQDLFQRAKRAKDYLDQYHNGRHRLNAQGIIAEAEQQWHAEENAQHLTKLEEHLRRPDMGGAPTKARLATLQKLRQDIDALPNPEVVTEELVERQSAFRRLVVEEMHKLEGEIARQDREKKLGENARYIEEVAQQISGLTRSDRTEARLRELRNKIDDLPNPEVVSDDLVKRQADLHQQLGKQHELRAEETRRARWQVFVEKYNSLMKQKQVMDILEHVQSWDQKTPEWKKLSKNFIEQIPSIVKENWSGVLKRTPRDWDEARREVDIVRNGLQAFEILTPDQWISLAQSLEQMRGEIDADEDRTLYNDVRSKKDRDSTSTYLQRAPRGKMTRVVQEYQNYLDALKNTMELTLTLERIIWGDTWDGYKNTVTVSVNGTKLIEETGIKGRPWQSTGPIGSRTFYAKLKDPMQLRIDVVTQPYYPWENVGNGGWGLYDKTVEALSGRQIPLQAEGHSNHAIFTISGIPPEPPLPAWGTS